MEVDDETCNVDASPSSRLDLTPTTRTRSRARKNVENVENVEIEVIAASNVSTPRSEKRTLSSNSRNGKGTPTSTPRKPRSLIRRTLQPVSSTPRASQASSVAASEGIESPTSTPTKRYILK